jgi:hypothetical protein
MKPELQQAIEECRKRGIVPGAVVRCASSPYGDCVVLPYSEWEILRSGSVWVGKERDWQPCWGYYSNHGNYATVITPVPAPQEEEGLKEGDACECGPAMRAAIIELAKELGLWHVDGIDQREHNDTLGLWFVDELKRVYWCCKFWPSTTMLEPEEFIRRMRVTAKKPKPVSIAGHNVLVTKGTVEIDDTVYANSTIRAIAEKLID